MWSQPELSFDAQIQLEESMMEEFMVEPPASDHDDEGPSTPRLPLSAPDLDVPHLGYETTSVSTTPSSTPHPKRRRLIRKQPVAMRLFGSPSSEPAASVGDRGDLPTQPAAMVTPRSAQGRRGFPSERDWDRLSQRQRYLWAYEQVRLHWMSSQPQQEEPVAPSDVADGYARNWSKRRKHFSSMSKEEKDVVMKSWLSTSTVPSFIASCVPSLLSLATGGSKKNIGKLLSSRTSDLGS